MSHTVPTPDVVRELKADGYTVEGVEPTYRRVIGLVNDGQLPVIKVGCRYYALRSKFPEIAALLGMTPPAAGVAASRTHNHAMAA